MSVGTICGHGPTGRLKLSFRKQLVRFENYVEWDDQEVVETEERSV